MIAANDQKASNPSAEIKSPIMGETSKPVKNKFDAADIPTTWAT